MKYIEPGGLSRIGLGTYNMSVKNREHCEAFGYALKCGCNLVDTAVNYEHGQAEEMIGSWIKEYPASRFFLVSKAGYVNKKDLPFLKKLQASRPSGLPWMSHSREIDHCIHPDYLAKKIKLTLKRLNRKWLDGFLLHNPEYFLLANPGNEYTAAFYERITAAFSFLEEYVHKGIIRYYGVSSNTLGLFHEPAMVDLPQLVKAAKTVADNNHFRLLQFPFNFAENAVLQKKYGGRNLLQLAHAHELITFSNRPLNMHTKNGFVRLAIYADPLSPAQEREADDTFAAFIDLINRKLLKLGAGCTAFDLEVITNFSTNWKKIGNQAAVDMVFLSFLQPLLNTLFEDSLPEQAFTGGTMTAAEINIINKLYEWSCRYSEITMTSNCKLYVEELRDKGILDAGDHRPLPVQACHAYLQDGIDHVLTGMRKKEYIDEMKTLFANEAAAVAV